jgi:hypothetical protein
LLSTAICLTTLLVMMATSDRMWHWYVIPVLLSGILATRDGAVWLTGRSDAFDPAGLIGMFGFHFFFLSFLLHEYWQFWWHYHAPPLDWRPWLGYAATLNACGLLVYRLVIGYARRVKPLRPKTRWRLNRARFVPVWVGLLAFSAALQIYVYSQFGGLLSFVNTRFDIKRLGEDPFAGMGWLTTMAEAFPVLAVVGAAVLTREWAFWRSRWSLPVALGIVFVLALFFGGLRGSRSTIFFMELWAVTAIHLWVRPISRKLIFVGAIGLFVFMNGYLYYKYGGLEGLKHLGDAEMLGELANEEYRGGTAQQFIVLHDFGRADSEALALYLLDTTTDFEPVMGRSYVAGALSVVPRAIWPARPPNFFQDKSDLMFGVGTGNRTAWVLGFSAEAALNFGPFAIPVAMGLLGVLIALVRRWQFGLGPFDSRLLILPLFICLPFNVLLGESQLVMYYLVKNGLLPTLLVLTTSQRIPVAADPRPPGSRDRRAASRPRLLTEREGYGA